MSYFSQERVPDEYMNPRLHYRMLMTRTTTNLSNLTGTCGPSNCSFPQGFCVDGICQCEVLFGGDSCDAFSNVYLTSFAIFSYIVFFIASVQLILCMVTDSYDDRTNEDKWKKAFRITIQKCILGTVIAATGTRAIYFTIQRYEIPERWADILHNVYYPTLITALSVLICFWAEVFCNSELSHTQVFICKHRYFVTCTVFNILLYLLLLSDVIATPLVNEVELARKSIVISSIFATLLVAMLTGFMHYSVRLFFRPDWRPLSDVFSLRININKQISSIVGVLSLAVMQCVVIVLLLLNLIGQYLPVDSHSLYTSSMVIHIIELGLSIWFCCCLWNFKRPASLWVLNPSVILQQSHHISQSTNETDPLVYPRQISGYGAVDDRECSLDRSTEFPNCWICLDTGEITDLFKPCNCPPVHRECLNKWIKERANNDSLTDILECQVCKKKYAFTKSRRKCITKDLKAKHWLIAISLVLAFMTVSASSSFAQFVPYTSGRVGIVFVVIVVDAIILKLFGFCLLWAYRRSRVTEMTIIGEPFQYNTLSKHEQKLTTPLTEHTT